MEKNDIILIAEDDDGHATLIQRNLRKTGIENEMIRFVNGKEILDYILKQKSGSFVILLDLQMPKMTGIEVLRSIKKSKHHANVPIIVLTTSAANLEVQECYKYGCANYMTKPIVYEKFVKQIEELGKFLVHLKVPEISVE
jgi:CheY-like chemotaxis protein